MPDTIPSIDEVLGAQGLLAQGQTAWEPRPQQRAMAELVAEALTGKHHAIIEAPTGVGKSFAYLVPLARHALATKRPVVVSTATIALQEQLIAKDIPRLQAAFPELKAVLVKGRNNYLSLRRLQFAQTRQEQVFETFDDQKTLKEISSWAAGSETGDLRDLGWDPPPQVWRQVQSDRNNCLGRRCPTFSSCFFYAARQRMAEAHLLVVNHHLYFSDLQLREADAGILPAHDAVVFDEAHAIEDIATDHLGAQLSAAQVRFFLDGLWNAHGKGLLAREGFDQLRPLVEAARLANETFWKDVCLIPGDNPEEIVRLGDDTPVENRVSPSLAMLGLAISGLQERAGNEDSLQELRAQATRAAELAGTLTVLCEGRDAGYVYAAHVPRARGTPALSRRPLAIGPLLKEKLFDAVPTVVLTSATLAADDSDRFLFLRKRVGLDGGTAKRLDSPFDYKTQAKLLVNRTNFDPSSPAYEEAMARWLEKYLATAHGGAFVLFTSYRQLQAVHDRVRPALDRARRFVLRHGDGMGRAQMLELFRRVGDGVLFGTSSFWEGVDVPGKALSHVIIAKLPFEVPNDPVVEARHQDIRKRGGDPFMERTVPEAIIRLKQGFGRLIRTASDTGTVVITDPRVVNKAYGKWFLRALPPAPIEFIDL